MRPKAIFNGFKAERHDILDFYNNRFDRDFVEFSVRVSDLENALLPEINQVRCWEVRYQVPSPLCNDKDK